MTARRIAALALLLALAAAPAVAGGPAKDAPPTNPGNEEGIGLPVSARPQGAVTLDVSQGKLIVLPAPATNVFIADPAVADVQVANADHVFVFGKKAGRTSLYALGRRRHSPTRRRGRGAQSDGARPATDLIDAGLHRYPCRHHRERLGGRRHRGRSRRRRAGTAQRRRQTCPTRRRSTTASRCAARSR